MGAVKTRLADRVAAEIQNSIFTKYQPGDKLPVENELAQLYSVSRVTVREAVSKLNAMGVVDVRQGEGTFVKRLTPTSFMQPMLPMLTLSSADLGDVFEVRILIEGKAAETAAERATDEELQQIKGILDEMEHSALEGDIHRYNDYDIQFHSKIAQNCHNQVITVISELLMDMIKESISISCSTPEHMVSSIVYHNRIYHALADRDPELSAALMREHLSGGLEFIRKRADGAE